MKTVLYDRFVYVALDDAEMTVLEGIAPERFLAPRERAREAEMRLPRARRQFRAGRVALKTAVLAVRNGRANETCALEAAFRRDDYAALEIGSRDERDRGVAPQLAQDYSRGSLAHIPSAAVAVYPRNAEDALGCDVVEFGAVKRNMLDLFFTETEREFLNEPDVWATGAQDLFWAVKEAAYKAVSKELPFRANQIKVMPLADGSYRAQVEGVVLPAFVVERDADRATVVAIR